MKLKYMMLILLSLIRLSTRICKSCSNCFCSSCGCFSKIKSLKGVISQLICKSFQRMINTNNEDIFCFLGFPPLFSSRNHLTTERHIFSLELLLKTFSDYDFRAATGPISVLGDKSQKKTWTRKSTSCY